MIDITSSPLVKNNRERYFINIDIERFLEKSLKEYSIDIESYSEQGYYSQILDGVSELVMSSDSPREDPSLGDLLDFLEIAIPVHEYVSSDSLRDIEEAMDELEEHFSDEPGWDKVLFLANHAESIIDTFNDSVRRTEEAEVMSRAASKLDDFNETLKVILNKPYTFYGKRNKLIDDWRDAQSIEISLSENDVGGLLFRDKNIDERLKICRTILNNDYTNMDKGWQEKAVFVDELFRLAAFKGAVDFNASNRGNNTIDNALSEVDSDVDEHFYEEVEEIDLGGIFDNYIDADNIFKGTPDTRDCLHELGALIEQELPEMAVAINAKIEKIIANYDRRTLPQGDDLTINEKLERMDEAQRNKALDDFIKSLNPMVFAKTVHSMNDASFDALKGRIKARVTGQFHLPESLGEAVGHLAIAETSSDPDAPLSLSTRILDLIEIAHSSQEDSHKDYFDIGYYGALSQFNALDLVVDSLKHDPTNIIGAKSLALSLPAADASKYHVYIAETLKSLQAINREHYKQADLYIDDPNMDRFSKEASGVLEFHTYVLGLYQNGEYDPLWQLYQKLPAESVTSFIQGLPETDLEQLIIASYYEDQDHSSDTLSPFFADYFIDKAIASGREASIWEIREKVIERSKSPFSTPETTKSPVEERFMQSNGEQLEEFAEILMRRVSDHKTKAAIETHTDKNQVDDFSKGFMI